MGSDGPKVGSCGHEHLDMELMVAVGIPGPDIIVGTRRQEGSG